MARWAKWGGPVGDSEPRHLRPSERRGAGQQPKPKKPGKPADVSPEAIARARERLEPPKAPWHPLPLAELAIVIGMIAMLVAAVRGNTDGVAAAFMLILLGTAEFSWREHRHGYRSHSTILAAAPGVALALALWRIAGVDRNPSIAAGIIVFLLLWGVLARSFDSAPSKSKVQP